MSMSKKYECKSWEPGCGWPEEYDMLIGPNNFECCLTEPEDRVWRRDGRKVVEELNRLESENTQLKAERDDLRDLIREVSYSGVEMDDARLDYLVVQIARSVWDDLVKLLASFGAQEEKHE